MTDTVRVSRGLRITAEDFDRLLRRLDSDRDRAGEKYEHLRSLLVKFFECNRCTHAEDLADESLDIVARKPDDLEIESVAGYALGVARQLRQEVYKRNQRELQLEDSSGRNDVLAGPTNPETNLIAKIDQQMRVACLRECLDNLRVGDRGLALKYYDDETMKHKIYRQVVAREAGISLGALRVKMNHIRDKLEKCAKNCLERRRKLLNVAWESGPA